MKEDNFLTFLFRALLLWVPLVALVLWAITFITTAVTFSWVFVAIIGGVLALITAFVTSVNAGK